MVRRELTNRRILIAGLIIVCLILTAHAWARNQERPEPKAVLVEGQPPNSRFHLEAALGDDVIVGRVTAFQKNGQPRTDLDGNVHLLSRAGERIDRVPLELTGPGHYRFITSIDRLEPRGYLEVHLPGGSEVSEERLLYRVDPDLQAARWVLSASEGMKPASVGATGGPDEFGYTWDDTAVFNWVDASGGPSVSLRDDYWVGPFDIGFDFEFYGRTYGEFYIDSNGYIGFDGVQIASHPGNGSLKDASRPNNIIAPFWDDLDPSRGGTVRYRTLGSTPSRRLVVSWRDVPLSDSVSDRQSFQVILHEDTNDITFQYPDTREGVNGDGSSATIGLENDDGTIGLEYSYLIPINVNHAIHFDYGQQPYNTFVTPKRLGGIVGAGEEAAYPLKVKNLGYNSDSFSLERLESEGSDWEIRFYEADGTTPLVDNDTGPIEPGDEKEIVIKVDVPEGAEVGESVRAEVRADSDSYDPPTPSPTPETPTPTPTPDEVTFTGTVFEYYPGEAPGAATEWIVEVDEVVTGPALYGQGTVWIAAVWPHGTVDDGIGIGDKVEVFGSVESAGSDWEVSLVGSEDYYMRKLESARVLNGAFDDCCGGVCVFPCAWSTVFGGPFQVDVPMGAAGIRMINPMIGFDLQCGEFYVGEYDSYEYLEAPCPLDVFPPGWVDIDFDQDVYYQGDTGEITLTFESDEDPEGDDPDWFRVIWFGPSGSGDVTDEFTHAASGVYEATVEFGEVGYRGLFVECRFGPGYDKMIWTATTEVQYVGPMQHEDLWTGSDHAGRREVIGLVAESPPGAGHDDTTVDVAVGTTFAQVYTDNESGDGTEDPEYYFNPVQDGKQRPRRVTTDEDRSSYVALATMPDGNAVNVWNTLYYNGTTWVEEIYYAVLAPSGEFTLPVTRLTDNSDAQEAVYDFSASADVAQNGNVAIGWAQQEDTDGDLAFNRSSARYVVISSRGGIVRPPTFLTNNAGSYPRDYPPSVAALTSGRFLLTWERSASPSGPVDIYYAVLNNDGSIATPKRRLTDGTGFSVTPRVAPLPNGQAAIVWTTYNDYGYRELAYATVNSSGGVVNGPTQITSNGTSGAESRRPDVVALSDNRLAVAWTRETYGDQQIQYTIISDSEPPVPVTETPTSTPETPTPTSSPTPAPSPTPTQQPPSWVTIASQDFEGTFPGDWELHDNNGSEHGEYVWGKRSCRSYAGTYSGWAVGGGAHGSGLSCGSHYPDYAWSWLIYGPFSLADATAAELSFKMWLNSEPGYDGLLWCASTDGASFECDSTSGSTSGQWVDINADLSSLDGNNYLGRSNVWVALIFYSDQYQNEAEGAYVDNVLLRKFTSSAAQVQIDSAWHSEGLTPLKVSEPMNLLRRRTTDQVGAPRPVRGSADRVGEPARADWVIRTVPNDLSRANLYVSLTTDENDNLIMTWLDSLGKQYLFYALAGSNGNVRTPATILQRTRHSALGSSRNGQGNDVLEFGFIPQKPVTVHLPALLKSYRSGPPVPPVINGGFESGEDGWVFGKDTSNAIRPAPRPDVVGSRVRSGSRAAVLGDENAPCEQEIGVEGYRLSSWIHQDIRVPNSETAQLSFYYRMLTYDKWSAFKFDRLEIYLDGTLIGNLGNTTSNYGCGSIINDLGWRRFTYDLSAYRGRTVRLKLVNVTDPDKTYSTWTYIDDVGVRP